MTVLFTGCSITAGVGLDNEKLDEYLFCNQIVKNLEKLQNHPIINDARCGFSNEEIFKSTARRLLTDDLDYIFVCWTGIPRWNFWPDSNNLSKMQSLTAGENIPFLSLYTELASMTSDYSQFRDVILYSNILLEMSKLKNCQIFFINCLVPIRVDWAISCLISDVTLENNQIKITELLGTFDLDHISQLDLLKEDFVKQGDVLLDHWLDISERVNILFGADIGNDGSHPGPTAHTNFATKLISKLKDIL
jgi:hypothetical protein